MRKFYILVLAGWVGILSAEAQHQLERNPDYIAQRDQTKANVDNLAAQIVAQQAKIDQAILVLHSRKLSWLPGLL